MVLTFGDNLYLSVVFGLISGQIKLDPEDES